MTHYRHTVTDDAFPNAKPSPLRCVFRRIASWILKWHHLVALHIFTNTDSGERYSNNDIGCHMGRNIIIARRSLWSSLTHPPFSCLNAFFNAGLPMRCRVWHLPGRSHLTRTISHLNQPEPSGRPGELLPDHIPARWWCPEVDITAYYWLTKSESRWWTCRSGTFWAPVYLLVADTGAAICPPVFGCHIPNFRIPNAAVMSSTVRLDTVCVVDDLATY